MTQVLELPAGDAKCPGVVIIPEWWGVNEQIKGVAKRYAEAGFCAVVVDIYDGVVTADADEAAKLMKGLAPGKTVGKVGEAVAALRAHPRCSGKIAVTGYCLGGAQTLASAVNVRGLACTVAFYGLPGDLDWAKADAPIQAHFATVDDWATVAGAEKIKAAVTVPMELHVYEAQHAFCNERRPEVYDAAAAKLAWDRALAFVRAHTA